jgi:hypothetical protein
VRERRTEVQANTHLFRVRFNDERTQKTVLTTELAQQITRVVKLKDRYECMTWNAHVDQSNEVHIRLQAQHIIQVLSDINDSIDNDEYMHIECFFPSSRHKSEKTF